MDFNDALLDAPETVEHPALRHLAGAGARIRQATSLEPIGRVEAESHLRGVIVLGAEARLLRAVLEPVCPTPLIAWSAEGLPSWVGPLDLVVVLGGAGNDLAMLASAREAVRRGASLVVAAPRESELAEVTASRATVLIPADCQDATATAVAVLIVMHRMGIGPLVVGENVAEAADLVAEASSPQRDLAHNRAKELAIALADDFPMVWGGTVLAARASRRIAEAIRNTSGRMALAVDADDLYPLLRKVKRRDPFTDPVDQPARDRFPVLVVLEDKASPAVVHHAQIDLVTHASALGIRVHTISAGDDDTPGSEVDRYVTLLQSGLYGAAYLGVGLGG